MKLIIGTDSSRFAQEITYAIIGIMEKHRLCLDDFDQHAAYSEIVNTSREARNALQSHGDHAIPFAALLMDRVSEVHHDDTGEHHPDLRRIADELRVYVPESTWADASGRIMEERAHLFALAGGE